MTREIAAVERRNDAVLAKEAGGQRDIALDVVEEARIDLRQNEGHPIRIDLGRATATCAFVAQGRQREMDAICRFRTHSLVVAQHTIDRGHANARATRNHHTCSRHVSPPVPNRSFWLDQGSFFRDKCKFFCGNKCIIPDGNRESRLSVHV
nr:MULTISPECIES: hypothetical protein [Paraburkholderia]